MQQFKVGDWVEVNDKNTLPPNQRVIFKIDYIDKFYNLFSKNEVGYGNSRYFKHWQTKPDEYVWYGYELVQVIDNSDTIKICRQDSDAYEEVTLDKLEPFIGTLPSFIESL